MLSYMPLSALEPCGIEMSRPYIVKGYIVSGTPQSNKINRYFSKIWTTFMSCLLFRCTTSIKSQIIENVLCNSTKLVLNKYLKIKSLPPLNLYQITTRIFFFEKSSFLCQNDWKRYCVIHSWGSTWKSGELCRSEQRHLLASINCR